MSTWLASIKLVWSGLLAALPTLRRGKAERDAGKNPHSVPESHFDDLFNGAIKRLGAVSYDDSLWEQFKTNVGAAFVRPDDFWRTNIRGWLSRPEVNAALGNLVKAHLASAPKSPSDYETLVSSYLLLSEEPRSSAEHYVFAAVTFLKASIQGAVKDSGVAAILQAGLGSMHDRFDEIIDTRSSSISDAIAVHHGEDAENTLNAILKRRATHGYDVLAELNELARCISNDGKFSSAPSAVKAKIYDWIVRLSASSGQLEKAKEA